MLHPEAIFLSESEYRSGLKNRIDESKIFTGDDLYSIMFSLAENQKNREAATLPAQVVGKTALHESGLCEINLSILDSDLVPHIDVTALFLNGLWIDVKKQVNLVDPSEGARLTIPPTEAYIKDYDDGVGDLRDLLASDKKKLVFNT